MLAVSHENVELALELFTHHRELDAFDSLIAAVAVDNAVDALVSADRRFHSVPGLAWRDLADLDVHELSL